MPPHRQYDHSGPSAEKNRARRICRGVGRSSRSVYGRNLVRDELDDCSMKMVAQHIVSFTHRPQLTSPRISEASAFEISGRIPIGCILAAFESCPSALPPLCHKHRLGGTTETSTFTTPKTGLTAALRPSPLHDSMPRANFVNSRVNKASIGFKESPKRAHSPSRALFDRLHPQNRSISESAHPPVCPSPFSIAHS